MSNIADEGAIAGWPAAALEAFAPALQGSLRARPQLTEPDLNALGDGRAQRLQAQVLANRGVAPAEMRDFLRGDWHADPTLAQLPVFRAAVARLRQAIDAQEHITVFGDYDCDGITSCVILVEALRAAGAAHVASRVPSRDDDGRGLNPDVVRELHERGTQLIVTTDCGTANVAEVEQARSVGMDVLVTDHHPPHGEVVTSLVDMIVVNPLVEPHPAFDPNLSGAGVAFRVAEALLTSLVSGRPDFSADAILESLLDLAAVGTISDLVPLSHANWALAHAGLQRLREAPRPGLRALMESAGVTPAGLTDRDISFALAPRLNAAPRLGRPELARDLLLAEAPEEARTLAGEIEALNTRRQDDLEVMMADAREQALEQAPAVAGSIDGTAFEWIADADPRIGPCLEIIVNGGYSWVPFSRLRELKFEAPSDLRDKIWVPTQVTWTNGGQAIGFIPGRYAGSERSDDHDIVLARKTDWVEQGSDQIGLGQRMLATDATDYPLLDARLISFDVA